jgi:hypothetical protein
MPDPSDKKKNPVTVVAETTCAGTIQTAEIVFEITCTPLTLTVAWMVSVPLFVPV